ncbi:MAG TPA: CoA pyrophosphatase, partial [Trueperaceae bacterium]|nr:CoA pyrophosphatase [Trueperaceae bacterium]
LDIPGFRHAAVLVPLLDTGAGLQLLLTVRAATLRSHAGQIALPGGRLEPGEGFIDAALRETSEEVGIAVDRDDVLGELSDHPSPAGFVARPIVARVHWPQEALLDPGEVAEVFTVPLDDLRVVVPSSRLVNMNQFQRRIFAYQWGHRNIWGFTGNVIRNLFDVIDGRDDDPFAG